jgi:hypothetical protein
MELWMSTQEIENLKELLRYTRQLAAESDNKLRVARQFIGHLTSPDDYGYAISDEVKRAALATLEKIR